MGESASGLGGIQTALDTRPDVVVTDVGLPDVDGVEVTKRLRELLPESRVLVLTVHDEDTYVFTLIQAGASGYLLKNAAGNDLVDAIRAVAAGKPWLQPEIAQRLMNVTSGASQRGPVIAEQDLIEPLTAREVVVLKLLAGAASNREIATNLAISTRTVETHLANIYGKLGVRGRTEAMLWAIHAGMAQG